MSEIIVLRPLWLLALLPWLWWCWQARRPAPLFAPPLARYLLARIPPARPWRQIAALMMILALAGPARPQAQQPLMQAPLDVWLLDLSPSMLATDLAPDRATRARLLLQELLARSTGQPIALILFSADAYLALPPTDDRAALRALLPDLRPDVMPTAGSAPSRAVRLALDALARQSPARLLLVTDGISEDELKALRHALPCQQRWLPCEGPRLDIVLLAGDSPVRLDGAQGLALLPAPDRSALRALARLSGGELYDGAHELPPLLSQTTSRQLGAGWQDLGPWLLLPLLLLALLARRGQLWLVLLCLPLLTPPPLQSAENVNQTAAQPEPLPQTRELGALELYEQGRYREAAAAFTDPIWQGNAWYRAGEYAKAEAAYRRSDSITALYNLGNALAYQGRFDEARSAYRAVLARDPKHQDARANLALLEQPPAQSPQQAPAGSALERTPTSPQQAEQGNSQAAPPVVLLRERLRKQAEKRPKPRVEEPW